MASDATRTRVSGACDRLAFTSRQADRTNAGRDGPVVQGGVRKRRRRPAWSLSATARKPAAAASGTTVGNYRANPVWENGTFRFRDIHLFDQRLESDYLNEANPSTQCFYTTLPVVDGLNWSSVRDTAGLRLMFGNLSESPVRARVGEPEVERSAEGELRIAMPLDEGGRCVIRLNERSIRIELPPSAPYRPDADDRSRQAAAVH